MQYSRSLETRADLDRWAPTFLGGQFGEELLLGFAGPGTRQDNAMVKEHVLAYLGESDAARQFFEHAFNQARERVKGEGVALRKVTKALLRHEHLTRADIERLLEQPGK